MTTVSEHSPPTVTPPTRRTGALGLLRRLHFFAGILIAPLLIAASLTGLLYAFSPTIEKVWHRDALTATATGPHRPVSEQVRAAQEVHPDLEIHNVRLPEREGRTTSVQFVDPSQPSPSYRPTVFVDPADLRITGDIVQYGSSRAMPIRAWLSQGHRSLWLGEPGRYYVELAASWMGAIALSGVYLWWSARRRRGASELNSRQGRGRSLRLHESLGVLLLPGLLFLTVTGLTWSVVAGSNIGQVRSALDWRAPTGVTTVATPGTPEAASAVERSVTAARESGLEGMIDITAPAGEVTTWMVRESRQAWRFTHDTVTVDGRTGEVLSFVPFSDWPLAAKLTEWLIELHIGNLLGLANQIALALLGAGIIALVYLGFRMWWQRGREGFGRAPVARRPHPA
ncbi:PepSY-associated TM helix domain-containing protein, partial [Corynebacterium nasicanis]